MGLTFLKRWFFSSLLLGALYLAYAALAAPRLEPAVRISQPPSQPAVGGAVQPARPDLAALFAPGSWELENPKIIETEQATLLLRDYQPTPDGKLNITPCTLIVRQPSEGGKPPRPVVIRAPEGAVLQFDRALDLARAQFGRILGGRLPGEVTIDSPPSTPEADDALRIVTRNVQLDAQRVFTPHEVEFRYGKSHGRGRDLTLVLRPKTDAVGVTTAGSVGGVSTLTLSRLDQLHLEFPGGRLPGVAAARGAQPPGRRGPSQSAPPLDVSCAGGLLVDFEQQLLSLDDRVQIERRHAVGPADVLRCARLRLYFAKAAAALGAAAPGAAAAKASASAATPRAAEAGGWALARLVATGTPLTIEAPQTGSYVAAAKLEYLPPQQRVVLEAGGALAQVTLRHGPHEFVAPELQYELAAEGALGKLWASGPGRLKTEQGAPPQPVTAVWKKELRIQPQGERKVISLVDGAAVAFESLGRFQAGEIYLWIVEQKHRPATGPAPTLPGEPTETALADEKSAPSGGDLLPQLNITPDQLLALGQVEIDSPRLHARTARLEAEFFEPPAAAGAPPAAPFSEPAAPAGTAAPAGGGDRAPPAKYDLTGDEVRMRISRSAVQARPGSASVGSSPSGLAAIDQFTIKGRVHLEEVATPEITAPLRLDGDAVTLTGGTAGKAQLVVVGRPARVTARGVVLQGGAIQYDQAAGRMWIDGPGESVLPPLEQGAPEKPPLTPPEPIRVTWSQGLNFDGAKIAVRGDVHAENASGSSVADMQLLEAHFAQPIDLAQLRSPRTVALPQLRPGAAAASAPRSLPEVARLVLSGQVRVENWTLDEQRQALARNVLLCPQISFDRATGELLCEGKGELATVRRGGLEVSAGGAPLTGAPPSPDKLTHLRIHFERGFRGELARREVVFDQKVEAIYAQVDDFRQEVTLAQLDQQGLAALGPSGLLLTADRLRAAQMQFPGSGKPWFELDAQGNTRADGLAFTCLANRISYTTAKEMLVIAGDGRSDAQIWYQQPGDNRKGYQAGQELRYWPRTGDLKGEGLKVIDLQLGEPIRPTRRR